MLRPYSAPTSASLARENRPAAGCGPPNRMSYTGFSHVCPYQEATPA